MAHERSLGLADAASVAAESERDSDMRSGPPHRRGSIAEASCPTIGVEAENMGPLPRNRGITGGQAGKEAAVLWLVVVAERLVVGEQVQWLAARRLMVAGQQPP